MPPETRFDQDLAAANEQLIEIRALMADFSLECECETHTYHGEPLLIVDEDGKVAECGGGYFATADGKRFTEETRSAGLCAAGSGPHDSLLRGLS